MNPKKISVLVGSLRKESFNRKTANKLIELAPESLEMEIVEIGNLALYNEDLDANPPQEWLDFRDKIRNSNGVLFVSPEYNRSMPGVLKNAIDVGSRPYGHSVWDKKPGAVMTVSPGAVGGFGSNHHIRQCMVFLNVPIMQQPEAYIGNVNQLFTEEGGLVESTEKFLKKFLISYEHWVNLF